MTYQLLAPQPRARWGTRRSPSIHKEPAFTPEPQTLKPQTRSKKANGACFFGDACGVGAGGGGFGFDTCDVRRPSVVFLGLRA